MGESASGSKRLSAEAFGEAYKLPLRLVLDNIRSGQNVGACFRSADAFRIEGLDLCGITCHPPHRDILKSALGASDHVPWEAHDNALLAIRALQAAGWKVAAVEQAAHSTPLHAWQPQSNERWALVFGNEVRGVLPEVLAACDLVVEMPQYGVKQSINVSVCAGVVLWQAALHMRHGATGTLAH
jgi:tRNA G18 (ribose-2'-O)-methylase SpoU